MDPPPTPSIDLLDVPGDCPEEALRRLAVEVLALCDRKDAALCIAFVDDDEIRRLNREFRNVDSPTDVLAFPGGEGFPGDERYLGDIAVSVPTARRQAEERGHSARSELLILAAHGLLHLCGCDHESDSGEMAALERSVREKVLPRFC